MNFILSLLALAISAEQVIGLDNVTYAVEVTNRLIRRGPPMNIVSARSILDPTTVEWINQPLDHFDNRNKATWKMRYYANTKNFKAQSPIFIYVGGEWAANPYTIISGHFYDMGKELNAALYYSEHRFYGESKPTEDLSVENLQYVHTRQALADLAELIKTLKSKPNMKNSKVVIASGSYGGNMITWFKMYYPELVVGGWASSAPILAKVDFVEYNQVSGATVKTVCGANVYNQIANGYEGLERLIKSNPDMLKKKLNLCPSFDTTKRLDVMELFSSMTNLFNGIVQGARIDGIKQRICSVFENFKGNDVDAVSNFYVSRIKSSRCTSASFEDSNRYYKRIDWRSFGESNDRAWLYQTCTQFGYFMTSSAKSPYGSQVLLDHALQQCKNIFGMDPEAVHNAANATNKMFGGLKPNVENIFWSHGSLDPWSSLGVHQNRNGKRNVVDGYSHFYDQDSINLNRDTAQMIELKNDVRKAIRSWLGVK